MLCPGMAFFLIYNSGQVTYKRKLVEQRPGQDEHPWKKYSLIDCTMVDHDWRGGAKKVNRALTITSPRGHIGQVSSRVHLDSASFPAYLGVPVDHVLVLCSGHLCSYSTVLARPRHCTSHDLARHRKGSRVQNSTRHRGGSNSARHRVGSIVQKSVMRQCGG